MTNETAKRLKIIPLGGLEQIGMNITAFEYDDSIVVVDCGLAFPEDDMYGIDLVIPDISYLLENQDRVKGFVFTHGHEDHIGALPYILKQLNIPIYATKLTMGLIELKLEEHGLMKTTRRKVVHPGQTINLGQFRVEFIKTNHSIQDAVALAIYSPAGTVIHTGDFKVDYTPVFGDSIDLQRFAEIGRKGVLALMCDSTNAERPGYTASERTVGKAFETIFSEHGNSRLIIATFASNVDRVQQIIDTAYKYGRKVVIEGRSMVNVISTAEQLGYISIPENTLVTLDQMRNYPDEQMVLITTGSQGESMAALSRMAASMHKKVQIKPGDTIVFSSNPIPGNEKSVSKVMNELYAKSGDVLEIDGESAEVTGHVQNGGILVDGLGVGDVGNIVLRDRQHLAEDGIIIVVMTLGNVSGEILSGPDIVSRGFVYVRESEELMEEAQEVIEDAIRSAMSRKSSDWGRIKNAIRDDLSDFLWKRTKRSPMILPIIMEVEE